MKAATEPKLEKAVEDSLDSHLRLIKNLIIEEAGRLSQEDSERGSEVGLREISKAVEAYAPGKKISRDFLESPIKAFLRRIGDSLTAITIVSAVLAIVFGVLGLHSSGQNQQGWLDITKIFAGAIVGSAGGAALRQK